MVSVQLFNQVYYGTAGAWAAVIIAAVIYYVRVYMRMKNHPKQDLFDHYLAHRKKLWLIVGAALVLGNIGFLMTITVIELPPEFEISYLVRIILTRVFDVMPLLAHMFALYSLEIKESKINGWLSTSERREEIRKALED